MTEWEFLYWVVIGSVWGWILATWITLLTPAIERAWRSSRLANRISLWRYRRWFASLSPAEKASYERLGVHIAPMIEAMRGVGLTAQEATEAFSKLR